MRARVSPYSNADHSAITVFIDLAVEDSSSKRLTETSGLEGDLLDRFRELVPGLEPGKVSTLNLRLASQQLRDAGHPTFPPNIVEKMIRGSVRDGREDAEGIASFQVSKIGRQQLSFHLQGLWEKRTLTSQHRPKVMIGPRSPVRSGAFTRKACARSWGFPRRRNIGTRAVTAAELHRLDP